MRVLLDTHILLWALAHRARLDGQTLTRLADRANEVFFSAASLWEISIKARLGRTDFPYDPDQISQAAVQTGFSELPVRSAAAVRVATLPDHHRDPFDRLLIAQAMSEPAQFYTADPALRRYSELVTLIRPRGLGMD